MKIGGRVHVDMYPVVKFIAIVGRGGKHTEAQQQDAEERLRGDKQTSKKFAVEKANIYKMWDGGEEELETLATYNLADSDALQKVYDTFIPIMIELSRITHNVLSDVCVSTTGQLVEFMLMHNSVKFNELIPNKPTSAR